MNKERDYFFDNLKAVLRVIGQNVLMKTAFKP